MLAGMLVPQARFAEVIALVSPLVATSSPDIRAKALFRWGTALSLEGADLRGAALRLREAEQLISELSDPDPVALAQVRFQLGSVAAQQGDLPAAVAAYDEAMRVPKRNQIRRVPSFGACWRGTIWPTIYICSTTWRLLPTTQLEGSHWLSSAGLLVSFPNSTRRSVRSPWPMVMLLLLRLPLPAD